MKYKIIRFRILENEENKMRSDVYVRKKQFLEFLEVLILAAVKMNIMNILARTWALIRNNLIKVGA